MYVCSMYALYYTLKTVPVNVVSSRLTPLGGVSSRRIWLPDSTPSKVDIAVLNTYIGSRPIDCKSLKQNIIAIDKSAAPSTPYSRELWEKEVGKTSVHMQVQYMYTWMNFHVCIYVRMYVWNECVYIHIYIHTFIHTCLAAGYDHNEMFAIHTYT